MTTAGNGWYRADGQTLEVTALAKASSRSFPSTPTCSGTQQKEALGPRHFRRASHSRMANTWGWEELKFRKACNALWESQKRVKDRCRRVKIISNNIAVSSAVKMDATERSLPP